METETKTGELVILTSEDPRVKRPAEPFDMENSTIEERKEFVKDLIVCLQKQTWGSKLGIAAPQVGISKRVMIVLGIPMFNPTWTPAKGVPRVNVEACYSLPKNTFYKVERPDYGWAKWYTIEGELREKKFRGLEALVFQHELSHLDGKCCDDLGEKIEKI